MILPFTPESFREIRRSSITTRLIYILLPTFGMTAIYWKVLMERFVNLLYTNFIIANPTTYEVAPESIHVLYDPVTTVIVFILCVLFWSMWFASTRIEEVLDL
jgi:hypothetical protein